MDENLRISISCDGEVKEAFEDFAATQADEVTGQRSIQPQNLDGTTASWIVIATLGAQVIPHFLNFIGEWRKSRPLPRVKIGDLEFENPTEEDLRLLREIMRKRIEGSD